MTGRARWILPAAFVLAPSARAAETEVSGTIPTGEWTKSGSPYRVGGDLEIPADATLTIQPGVVITFARDVGMVVRGTLRVAGTAEETIRFGPEDSGEAWDGVIISGEGARGDLQHLEMSGSSTAPNQDGAFNSVRGAEVELRNCWFHDFDVPVIENNTGARLIVRDSVVERCREAIHSDTSYALVEGVTIRDVFGYSDCIDYDLESTPQSVIRNCYLENNDEDDGIDLGGASALVEDVVICGVRAGKAISIDLDCTPICRRVFVYDCMWGLVVKDSATPIFEQCTISLCDRAVNCYEKIRGRGGGHGTAHSMIIWGNQESVVLDELSSFAMSHSIVAGGYEGEGNLDLDPLFVDPDARDFCVAPGSPSLGTGKDGLDMGACSAPEPPPATFVRGETNGDGSFDLGDAVTVLLYLFRGGRSPPCLDAMDADDNGAIDVSDAIFLLRCLFLGGSAPPPPFPDPGPDPTTDDPHDCRL